MKKNPQLLYDGEIGLIDILKIIWDGKIKLLLITLISLLVGFGIQFSNTNKLFKFIKS